MVVAAVRHPRWVVAALAALGIAVGGWFALRDSPLTSVEVVHIHGVRGPYAREIRAALASAARRQSTLHLDVASLRAVVAPYVVVRGLSVRASFPHTVHITVHERLPVANLVVAGARTAVAADGTVLGAGMVATGLPSIDVANLPQRRVRDPQVLADLVVLGAAPSTLRRDVTTVYLGPNGLTTVMRNGARIFFGDDDLPNAKWISASRVLGSPAAAGASYVDVRQPSRPAAGGLAADATAAGSSDAGDTSGPATDPVDAALAATLATALGGGATAASAATAPVATVPAATTSGAATTTPSPAATTVAGQAPTIAGASTSTGG